MSWGHWVQENNQSKSNRWYCWQEGLKGFPPAIEADSEEEARTIYEETHGFPPDYCVHESERGW